MPKRKPKLSWHQLVKDERVTMLCRGCGHLTPMRKSSFELAIAAKRSFDCRVCGKTLHKIASH